MSLLELPDDGESAYDVEIIVERNFMVVRNWSARVP